MPGVIQVEALSQMVTVALTTFIKEMEAKRWCLEYTVRAEQVVGQRR